MSGQIEPQIPAVWSSAIETVPVQLPVFVTAVMAVRRMAGLQWPGFDSGGLSWFANLTLPAVSLQPVGAPMGYCGVLLPLTVAGLMMANLHQAFSRAASGQSRTTWLIGTVQLGLEWLILPMFLTAMQLPQAVLVYWSTSSAVALLQAHLLRSAFMRGVVDLPATSKIQSTTSKGNVGKRLTEPEIMECLDRLEQDISSLFQQAAEWRAQGDRQGAMKALERIVQLDPQNSRAWYALGQTLSGMKVWSLAGHAYTEAAALETDLLILAKCWLGAGIAACNDGDPASGLQALEKAAEVALNQKRDIPVSSQPLIFTAGKLVRASHFSREAEEEMKGGLAETAVKALLSRGSILKSQGRWEEAVEAVKQAASLDKRSGKLYSALLDEHAEHTTTQQT